MPNLNFYADADDKASVLNVVFDLGLFRVFESYSEPDQGLREYRAADEVPQGRGGRMLELFVVGSGPAPIFTRIALNPGALGDATFRYHCQGWGLIQLYFGVTTDESLRWSHTNHNTEKRASVWADTLGELGDPAEWDWPAVTRASGRLNRAIRKLAVYRFGSRPVLPGVAQLIAARVLQYEYGDGIHSVPAFGSTPAERRGDRPWSRSEHLA